MKIETTKETKKLMEYKPFKEFIYFIDGFIVTDDLINIDTANFKISAQAIQRDDFLIVDIVFKNKKYMLVCDITKPTGNSKLI